VSGGNVNLWYRKMRHLINSVGAVDMLTRLEEMKA
jgi:hypothetical protein